MTTTSTARDEILAAAAAAGFEVTTSPIHNFVRIEFIAEHYLRIEFSKTGTVTYAQHFSPSDYRGEIPSRSILGAGKRAECLRIVARHAESKRIRDEKAQSEKEFAALKLSRSETPEQFVARMERDHPGYLEAGDEIVRDMDRREAARVSASNPPTKTGADIFDELDAQYAAADRFEVDPQNRGSIGPRRTIQADVNARVVITVKTGPTVDRLVELFAADPSRMPSRTAVTGSCGEACCGWCVLDDRPCVIGSAGTV